MAVLHRSLLTWVLCLIFFILLVLRLDDKLVGNWFIVFIPMWLFDIIIIAFIVFHMITHCKTGHDRNDQTMGRKVCCLLSVLLKVAFQLLLCIKLQYYEDLALYYVFIPLWLLLLEASGDIFVLHIVSLMVDR